jgi:TonB family protein
MKTPAAPGTSAAAVESQSRQNDYNRFVWSKVKKNWTMPAALMPKNNVEAIIEVRIAQSGAVEYIGFEKHSGNRYFDESALRAVKKSIPFPPLSGWVPNRSIEIGIRFHSAELR